MTNLYVPGATVQLRAKKPGERWERWWMTSFPAKLLHKFMDGYWWVEDANRRTSWVRETDLVVLNPKTGRPMPSELALRIAKAIKEKYSVGTSSTFCDEVDFDVASDEDLAELIDKALTGDGA